VLEVGLGGRLDAVNIVDADVAVITAIDIDHVEYLGDTREAIGAKLQVYGRDFRAEVGDRQWDFVGARRAHRALPIPALRGRWQLKNASAVLAALDELAEKLPVSLGEIKRGLTLVRLPGRLQVLPGRPAIVLDVAHNPHAARSLADGLGDMGFFENTFAVFAMLGDKDVAGVIDAMRGRIDRWYIATPQSDRAAPEARLAELLAERGAAEATRRFATVPAALEAARRDAGPNDRIVVFGSFTTVGEALQSLR
jgi:dihydrofolate synthase/folylpolyglutamate synthase